MDLRNFIDTLSAQLATHEKQSHLAWWNLSTTGDSKYQQEMVSAQQTLRTLTSSKEELNFLQEATTEDPLLERQRQILLLSYRENQIDPALIATIVEKEAKVEEIYTNYRPQVKGEHLSNNAIKNILKTSDDTTYRQQAWKASKEIGKQVSENVLELVHLRNQAAEQAGFTNYYSMQLKLQEINEEDLFLLLNTLQQESTPLWRSYKNTLDKTLSTRFGKELYPWHYYDPFFQDAPPSTPLDPYYQDQDVVAISKDYFHSLDLPVDDILDRSDLFERENKCQYAYCITIDRKQDVRILCNLTPSEYWMGVQLHELGHAIYDKFIDPTLPFLLRTHAHTLTTEAVAMLFGRQSRTAPFIQTYCQKTPHTGLQKAIAEQLLVFTRWILVMTHFERELYRAPDQNLNLLWWDLVETFQNVTRPPNRDAPDWAAKIHLAVAPVYYQNYILGEMNASQILNTLEQPLVNNPDIGHSLKTKLFHLGKKHPWEKTLELCTGERLNPSYFLSDLREDAIHSFSG